MDIFFHWILIHVQDGHLGGWREILEGPILLLRVSLQFFCMMLEEIYQGLTADIPSEDFTCIKSIFRPDLVSLRSLTPACIFNWKGAISMMLHRLEVLSCLDALLALLDKSIFPSPSNNISP